MLFVYIKVNGQPKIILSVVCGQLPDSSCVVCVQLLDSIAVCVCSCLTRVLYVQLLDSIAVCVFSCLTRVLCVWSCLTRVLSLVGQSEGHEQISVGKY